MVKEVRKINTILGELSASRKASEAIFTRNARSNDFPEQRGGAAPSQLLSIIWIQVTRKSHINSKEKKSSMGELHNPWTLKKEKEGERGRGETEYKHKKKKAGT